MKFSLAVRGFAVILKNVTPANGKGYLYKSILSYSVIMGELSITLDRKSKQFVDDHIHIRGKFFEILAILQFCKLNILKL